MSKVKYRKKCSKCGKYFDVINASKGLCDNCSEWYKSSRTKYEKEQENANL